jgi:hypothetical protein
MSTEENKALVLQMMHLQEDGDLNTADQLIASNWGIIDERENEVR